MSYGQRAKHALNLAQSNILEGYVEALVLGMKLRVSLDALLEVFEEAMKQELGKEDFAAIVKLLEKKNKLQFTDTNVH